MIAAAGLGMSAAAAAYGLCLAMNRTRLRLEKLVRYSIKAGAVKYQRDRFLLDIESRLKKSGLKKIKLAHYLLAVGIMIGVSVLLGAVYFKNPVAAMAMAATSVMLPEHLIFRREMLQRYQKEDLLISAVKIFLSEFIQTPQVERGLAAVARQCPEPLGSIFFDAYKSMISGIPPDKVYVVLMSRLDFPHGHMFVQALRAARTNSQAVVPLLNSLITKMSIYKATRDENINQVRGESLMSLLIAVAPLPAYLVINSVIPETNEFLRQTISGRSLVFGVFFSSVLWLILNRILERVEV